MEKCVHEGVCRYKLEDEGERCSNTEICKHFDDGSCGVITKRAPHKVGRKPGNKKEAENPNDDEGTEVSDGVTEKEFKRAKKQVDYFLKTGKLTGNQQLALDSIKGKHFKHLPEAQRQQMLDIAKDCMKGKAK